MKTEKKNHQEVSSWQPASALQRFWVQSQSTLALPSIERKCSRRRDVSFVRKKRTLSVDNSEPCSNCSCCYNGCTHCMVRERHWKQGLTPENVADLQKCPYRHDCFIHAEDSNLFISPHDEKYALRTTSSPSERSHKPLTRLNLRFEKYKHLKYAEGQSAYH